MTTTLTKQGHLVLPRELWTKRHLRPGDDFEILTAEDEPEEIVLRRVAKAPSADLVDHLLACPVKDFMPRVRRQAEPMRKVRL
jgi:bifunctional DNA-binding transcriptional regulator/antitoxin component of YhaV-PrlF toxin-antitoxin module